jgi:hypothetical protein
MNKRRSVSAITVSCLVIALVLPLVIYVTGYFALSRPMPGAFADAWCRCYRLKWQVEIFKPAAKVESAVTGNEISTYWMP